MVTKKKQAEAARRAALITKAESEATKLRVVATWIKEKSENLEIDERAEYIAHVSIVRGVAEVLPALAFTGDVESIGSMLGVLRRWSPTIVAAGLTLVGLAADVDSLTDGQLVEQLQQDGAPVECFASLTDEAFGEWEALGVTFPSAVVGAEAGPSKVEIRRLLDKEARQAAAHKTAGEAAREGLRDAVFRDPAAGEAAREGLRDAVFRDPA